MDVCYMYSWNPLPPPLNFTKEEASHFSHKKESIDKVGGLSPKKGVSLIFALTNPFCCHLFLCVWCVCLLLIYTISISVFCVS